MPLISRILHGPRTAVYSRFPKLRLWMLRKRFENLNGALGNIGCGTRGEKGWINVDFEESKTVNCVCDCRKDLPFPDNSFRGIFTEHFFEHIHYEDDVPAFLRECLRILAPGGVIRIIVPDAEKYLRAYCEPGWDTISKIRPLDAEHRDFYSKAIWNTKMELVNWIFRQEDQHKFAYDAETLGFTLLKYGFTKVAKQEFGRSFLPELCIDYDQRATESLYMEAIK